MRDGREITHPGKPGTAHHDAIVRPAGPVDESVGVLAARAPDGQVLGLVVHFSCHSTVVGGTKFSADYAGYLRAHLRSRLGPDLPVVFLLGACGDVTQVDNRAPGRDFGPDHADMMGRLLAGETLRTLNRMTWLDDAPVRVAVETARCAIRPEPDPKAEAPAFGLGSGWDEVFERERKAVAEQRAKTPVLDCEVQAVRVGPLGVVSNGSEFFADLGLRLKDASPLPTTWVATLTNEYLGYVCTPQAFVSGGYEPRTARSSKLAIDAGQRLIEAGVKALAATTS
jgi:hypothetical protein